MNSKDIRGLQKAYLEVVINEGFKELPREKMKSKREKIINKYNRGAAPDSWNSEFDSPEETKLLQRHKKIGAVLTGPTPRPKVKKEQVDLYDIILSHLLDEGYAETLESAEKIMVNMSEDWRESIIDEMLDEELSSSGKKEHLKW